MTFAAPHVQNLDEALQLNIYVGECQRVLTGDVRKRINDAEKELADLLKVRKAGDKGSTKVINNVEFTVTDRKAAREKCLNGKKVKKNRKWLHNIILAESSSEDESTTKIDDMVRLHKIRLRSLERFYQKPKLRRYKYYGAGLLVNNNEIADLLPNQQLISPIGFKTNGVKLNGNVSKRSLQTSSFAHNLELAGSIGTQNAPPKISPRKPKKKKQPPVPNPIPITSSLQLPELMQQAAMSQTSHDNLDHSSLLASNIASFSQTTTDLISDFPNDHDLSSVLVEAGALSELPVHATVNNNDVICGTDSETTATNILSTVTTVE